MFKSLGALGDMAKVMKQAKEMQEKAAELQEKLDTIEVDGSSGAGMVTATCTAQGRSRPPVDRRLALRAGGEGNPPGSYRRRRQ